MPQRNSTRLSAIAKRFGINLFDMQSRNQGIVHVIGPELGITLPGTTIVCGDSHTATHGAFGALAFGIGTSEVEHVLATQCMSQFKSKTMKIDVQGKRPRGVTAKDIILAIIGKIGIGGGNGHVVEYTGEAIRSLSMESRMTMCNMSIEGGARAGMVAPDETTFAYRRRAPFRAARKRISRCSRVLAKPGHGRGREIRHRRHAASSGHRADGHLGNQSRHGHAGYQQRSRPLLLPGSS